MTRWRQRLGEDKLAELIKESLATAHRTGALRLRDVKRELRLRSAVEPIIGHMKSEHRLDRNYLKGREGDRANAILAAAGYNFYRTAQWLKAFLRLILYVFLPPRQSQIT